MLSDFQEIERIAKSHRTGSPWMPRAPSSPLGPYKLSVRNSMFMKNITKVTHNIYLPATTKMQHSSLYQLKK